MVSDSNSSFPADTDRGGDQIQVGDIAESKNIAIGKDIQQTIYEGYTAEEVALLIAEARKSDATPTAQITIPPPPEPTKPPEIVGFVGRDQELNSFIEMLESTNLAVIAGMAGVGKTALAAILISLVVREPSRVFWHSFHEGEGIDGIVWGLAGFLAWHGKAELWNLLQSARLTGGQPPPTETLFDYLLQLVRDGNYLLCFDDFHHVDDDPVLNQLVERLRQALIAGQLSIVITSRRVPEFITLAQVEPIAGLSMHDAERLLQVQRVTLTAMQREELYRLTAGNAEFLILAIEALQNARDPDDLLEQLALSDDIERYLIKEVDDVLTGQERGVMNALAALLGYAATRDAIEAVVDRGNVFRTLRGLAERHLLVVQETDAGRAYRQHDLVREFYYEMSSRRERRKLHGRAGEYYRDEEVDLLLAGIHYERAGESDEAARLATADVLGIINRGQIRPLRTLLERVGDGGLATELSIAVNLAKGQVYTLQAESELAEAGLRAVLTAVDGIADETEQRILAARACRGMGELLEERSPREALSWLERGLERLQGADQVEEAALYIRSGTINLFLNQYQAAIQAAETGIALLPKGVTLWHSIALRDLSGVYIHLGDTQLVRDFAQQAIEICRQLHHSLGTIHPLMNLAIGQFMAGEVEHGLSNFNAALQLSIQTGNETVQAQVEQNLGTANFSMGDLDSAEIHLQKSLELATSRSNKRIQLYALRNLIDLYVDLEQWERATHCLHEAETLAQALDDQHNLMTILGLWCEVKLALGNFEEALAFAQERLVVAETLQEVVSQGISQAFLGKAYAAMGQYETAIVAFAESLKLIGDTDAYQVALTKMDWGKVLLETNAIDRGVEMLTVARQELLAIEEQHFVTQIDEILALYIE